MKKIAIMTAGGDCAGLNSTIKSVVLSAYNKGVVVVGILDGFIGFVKGKYRVLGIKDVIDIESIGGTILGSSNKENPFHYPSDDDKTKYIDRVDEGIAHLTDIDVEAMIIIGGDGTLDSARVICEHGMPVIGIPKTIDNDMSASSPTIGFNTAVDNVVDVVRKIKTTAYSHRRVFIIEAMGRTSGYLSLYSGIASGADVILLPEKDYNIDIVCDKVRNVMENDKRYCILVVSEACKEVGGDQVISKLVKDSYEQKRYGGVSEKIAEQIEEKTGYETRALIVGHIQRGGTPSSSDVIIGTVLGAHAFKLLYNKQQGYIVGIKGNEIVKMKFPKVRIPRLLDFENNILIKSAKSIGICFGD